MDWNLALEAWGAILSSALAVLTIVDVPTASRA